MRRVVWSGGMRLLGVGIWRRAFAFLFMGSFGKLIGGMGFLGWGIGRRIRIPIIGAFVCVFC